MNFLLSTLFEVSASNSARWFHHPDCSNCSRLSYRIVFEDLIFVAARRFLYLSCRTDEETFYIFVIRRSTSFSRIFLTLIFRCYFHFFEFFVLTIVARRVRFDARFSSFSLTCCSFARRVKRRISNEQFVFLFFFDRVVKFFSRIQKFRLCEIKWIYIVVIRHVNFSTLNFDRDKSRRILSRFTRIRISCIMNFEVVHKDFETRIKLSWSTNLNVNHCRDSFDAIRFDEFWRKLRHKSNDSFFRIIRRTKTNDRWVRRHANINFLFFWTFFSSTTSARNACDCSWN